MFSFLLMKLLELRPARYDAGLRLLTLNRLEKAYDRLTVLFREGERVLDLGCGTGGPAHSVELREMGVASLCGEAALRIPKPGGLLCIVGEVRPAL